MALKWPVMCWCAVKKLLTHSLVGQPETCRQAMCCGNGDGKRQQRRCRHTQCRVVRPCLTRKTQLCRAFNCRILYSHYLPTVILIIGIPSPTNSFITGLKPSFFCKSFPLQPFLFFFRTYCPHYVLLLLSISVLSFSFSVSVCFTLFSCRFHAVD